MEDSEDGGASLNPRTTETQEVEEWVTIVEPVTNETLIDTVLAQLECLTAYTSHLTSYPEKTLSWGKHFQT